MDECRYMYASIYTVPVCLTLSRAGSIIAFILRGQGLGRRDQ